jgi:putative transposase
VIIHAVYSFWLLIRQDQSTGYAATYLPDTPEMITTLKANNLVVNMSCRGNSHDNACAESFFALLKRERIRRKMYRSREKGKVYVFNYIELFYNLTRRHVNNNDLSPMEYEKNYLLKQSSIYKSGSM